MSFPLRPYTLIHGGSLELLVSPPPFVGIVHHLHTHFVEMGGPRLAGGGPSYPPLLNSRPSLESPLSVHLFVIQTTIFWASLLCLPVVGDSETKWCLGNKGVLLLFATPSAGHRKVAETLGGPRLGGIITELLHIRSDPA